MFTSLGKYRGAAHSGCNLKLKIDPRQHVTPVAFHNLRGYDSHFLIANLGSSAYREHENDESGNPQIRTIGEVSVIANNMERMLSFSWNRFRFVDSYQFLSASLERLVSATPDDMFTLSSTLDHHRLLKRKGKYVKMCVFFFIPVQSSCAIIVDMCSLKMCDFSMFVNSGVIILCNHSRHVFSQDVRFFLCLLIPVQSSLFLHITSKSFPALNFCRCLPVRVHGFDESIRRDTVTTTGVCCFSSFYLQLYLYSTALQDVPPSSTS